MDDLERAERNGRILGWVMVVLGGALLLGVLVFGIYLSTGHWPPTPLEWLISIGGFLGTFGWFWLKKVRKG